jgi:hypothetical protein
MKISQILKYIADLNPQNTPARLAFYNFLRHFEFSSDDLTPYVINTFFSHALEYPHWQTNKAFLSKEVQFLLENFVRVHKADFDFSAVRFPQNLQLIELESFADLLEVTNHYARSMTADDDKFRIIPDQSRRVILVTLKADQSVDVAVFDKKFVIRNGQLEPLRTDLKLSYDANLELKENSIHLIEVAPYLLAQFRMIKGQPQGSLLRGYVFQKYQELNGMALEEQSKVFAPLKRLEQIFIDKQSDPYYLNLVKQLSDSPARVRQGELLDEKNARRLLERAELAYREIFIGDKTLAGLINELGQIIKPTGSKDSELWAKQRPLDLTR